MVSDNVFREKIEIGYKEEAISTNVVEFKKVVESRRSIREFTTEKIPDEVVMDCLRMALKAPNSSNLQTWRFYRVKTLKTKEELVKACLDQPAAKTAAELIVITVNLNSWKKNAKLMVETFKKQEKNFPIPKSAYIYYEKLVPFVYAQGPLSLFGLLKKPILFFRGLVKPTPREPTSLSDIKIWANKSAALACENLMLAFRAHGFDSCPMEGYDSALIKKILKLKCDDEVVMVVSAGKRDPTKVYGPQIRFDEKLFLFEV